MKWRIWLVSLCVTLVSVVLFGIYATQVYYNSSVDDGKNYLKVYMNEFDATEFSFDEAGAKAILTEMGRKVKKKGLAGNADPRLPFQGSCQPQAD